MYAAWRAPAGAAAGGAVRGAGAAQAPRLRRAAARHVVTRAAQQQLRADEQAVMELPERPFLYRVGRRALGFHTDEDAVTKATGFAHGDRVRAFAGRYTGRLAVVVGLRGGALWLHFSGVESAEGVPLQQLHHHDLRAIDRVTLDGPDVLDPAEHHDGEVLSDRLLYSARQLKREAKVPTLLDDASMQHLAMELPTTQPCEIAQQAWVERMVDNALHRVSIPQSTARRVRRLLLLHDLTLPALVTAESIRRWRDGYSETDALVFSDAMAIRSLQWESTVELVFADNKKCRLPVGCISATGKKHEIDGVSVLLREVLSDPEAGRVASTHASIGEVAGQKWEERRGQSGMLVGRSEQTAEGLADPARVSVSRDVLYELAAFRGQHYEEDVPRAEVCAVSGPSSAPTLRYMTRAAAVELYGKMDPAERPQLYPAGGYPSYAHNHWHQSWGMVNEEGLQQFSAVPRSAGGGNSARMHLTDTPGGIT